MVDLKQRTIKKPVPRRRVVSECEHPARQAGINYTSAYPAAWYSMLLLEEYLPKSRTNLIFSVSNLFTAPCSTVTFNVGEIRLYEGETYKNCTKN